MSSAKLGVFCFVLRVDGKAGRVYENSLGLLSFKTYLKIN